MKMSEENKTGTTARKQAPAITVSSPASRSSIDELYRDNPGKNFAYAPLGVPEASLTDRELVPVMGKNGKPLQVGNKLIVEVKGDHQKKETAEQFKDAEEMIDATRDPKKSSPDKTAVARKPRKKKS